MQVFLVTPDNELEAHFFTFNFQLAPFSATFGCICKVRCIAGVVGLKQNCIRRTRWDLQLPLKTMYLPPEAALYTSFNLRPPLNYVLSASPLAEGKGGVPLA